MTCKNGIHKVGSVSNVQQKEIKELGYKYRATCTVCGLSILAKDKTEYDTFNWNADGTLKQKEIENEG